MQRPWGRTGPRVLKEGQGGPCVWSRVSKGRRESRVERGQLGQGPWAEWRKVGFIKGSRAPWRLWAGGDVVCHLKTVGLGTRFLPSLWATISSSISWGMTIPVWGTDVKVKGPARWLAHNCYTAFT